MSNDPNQPGATPAGSRIKFAADAMDAAAKLAKRCEGMNEFEIAAGCLAYVANFEESIQQSAYKVFGVEPNDAGSEIEWLRRQSWFYGMCSASVVDIPSERPATDIGLAGYLEAPTDAEKILGEYLSVKAQIKALEDREKELNAKLKEMIGEDGERVTLGDMEAIVTSQTRHQIDGKLARELVPEDILIQITKSSISTVLRVSKIKKYEETK
jgi:hypothetical protein